MISPTTQSQSAPHFRTTPRGSRSWRRVLSDTESDGFDSLYQESESNFSHGGHRPFQFDNDSISFSAYGGESDASVDGHSVLDADIINPLSYLDSDIDIDPMRAGPNQWNSDEREEDEESEEEEEEEEEENNISLLRRQRQAPFVGVLQDYHYLDVRGFNELFERLEEADSSRQGAPPAAVSFVNTLPRFVIKEGHLKHDSLTCAICKDFLSVGCVVNQLPCLHLYHPCCILPWLTARNSCPICRYELPTDDKDYEEGKRSSVTVTHLNEEDSSSSSDQNDDGEVDEFTNEYFAREDDNTGRSMRGRWLYLAGAPIVSLVGIIIVMWLKSPRDLPRGGSFFTHGSSSWVPNQRENRIRRWWSLF